ncbi:hypothetical protein MGSAQ_002154 [marine sediment metagenome]|uniref:Uncharacterized protein n=1 Tax=marine sediment metagenome TaxID=412755 RepID=A0A1B6NTW1_9ZZZZ
MQLVCQTWFDTSTVFATCLKGLVQHLFQLWRQGYDRYLFCPLG